MTVIIDNSLPQGIRDVTAAENPIFALQGGDFEITAHSQPSERALAHLANAPIAAVYIDNDSKTPRAAEQFQALVAANAIAPGLTPIHFLDRQLVKERSPQILIADEPLVEAPVVGKWTQGLLRSQQETRGRGI